MSYGCEHDVKLERTIVVNRRNNQLLISIPRKQVEFLKGRTPKSVRLEFLESDFQWS